MKSLEDFLAGLETISVNEKHAAQFTCDSDTISPNISTVSIGCVNMGGNNELQLTYAHATNLAYLGSLTQERHFGPI